MTLAPGEASTVEFERRLPKCGVYQEAARKSLTAEQWWAWLDEHLPRHRAVTGAEPRLLSVDERLKVAALRHGFVEIRRKVERMMTAPFGLDVTLSYLDLAEQAAIRGLETAMREGR